MGKYNRTDENDQYCVPEKVAKRLESQKILRCRIETRPTPTSASKNMQKEKNVQEVKKQKKMKKKEKNKLKKEAKKMQNAVQKGRPICQMNCTAHTFTIQRRLKNKNKKPPINLNFCRKKDTPSDYLKLAKIQQPRYLKQLYYSLFVTQNSNPESTKYSAPKSIINEPVKHPYPILPEATRKVCPFCKQYIINYKQHIKSEQHIHNWTTDDTLDQVKRKVEQYSELLKKDYQQYNNLYIPDNQQQIVYQQINQQIDSQID